MTQLYNLGFSISGQVSNISVQRGDFAPKGTVNAVLDSTPLLISIAQAEGSLALAEARLKRVIAGPYKLEIAEAKAEVTAIAAKPTEYGSKVDDRAADLAAARARLDFLLAQPLPEDVAVAQAEVTQAQMNLDATRAQLDLAKLIAPADGTAIKVLPDFEVKGTVSSIEPDEAVTQGGRYLVLIHLDEHPDGLR